VPATHGKTMISTLAVLLFTCTIAQGQFVSPNGQIRAPDNQFVPPSAPNSQNRPTSQNPNFRAPVTRLPNTLLPPLSAESFRPEVQPREQEVVRERMPERVRDLEDVEDRIRQRERERDLLLEITRLRERERNLRQELERGQDRREPERERRQEQVVERRGREPERERGQDVERVRRLPQEETPISPREEPRPAPVPDDGMCNPLTGFRARRGGVYGFLMSGLGVRAGNCDRTPTNSVVRAVNARGGLIAAADQNTVMPTQQSTAMPGWTVSIIVLACVVAVGLVMVLVQLFLLARRL